MGIFILENREGSKNTIAFVSLSLPAVAKFVKANKDFSNKNWFDSLDVEEDSEVLPKIIFLDR